jgi:hypothetical protein
LAASTKRPYGALPGGSDATVMMQSAHPPAPPVPELALVVAVPPAPPVPLPALVVLDTLDVVDELVAVELVVDELDAAAPLPVVVDDDEHAAARVKQEQTTRIRAIDSRAPGRPGTTLQGTVSEALCQCLLKVAF